MKSVSIGLDVSGDKVFLARTRFESNSPMVESLEETTLEKLWRSDLLAGARLVVGLRDSEVDFKPLQLTLRDNLDYQDVGRFELLSSLLEEESNYIFDIRPTAARGRYLGLTARLESIRELVNRLGLAPVTGLQSQSFRSRGLALAHAYTNYCQSEPGELIGLIDLTLPSASIAILYRDQTISLGHLPLGQESLADEAAVARLAIQARTLINFQISALSAEGLNLPLARLVLTGLSAERKIRDIFATQFPSGTVPPRLNRVFFGEDISLEEASERFLVAIGLSLN